jgi:hypothetical protein
MRGPTNCTVSIMSKEKIKMQKAIDDYRKATEKHFDLLLDWAMLTGDYIDVASKKLNRGKVHDS